VAGFSDDVLRRSFLRIKKKMIRKMNKPEGHDLATQTFPGEVTLLKHCINRISQLPKKKAAFALFLSEGCL
jgi:hypothetical protein